MATSGELGRTVVALARRRWRWLVAIGVAAGAVAAPLAVVLGWLFPSSLGLPVLRWAVWLWLALAGAGTALVVLVDRRPARRVTLATLGAIAALLVCAMPAGTFWTFAVEHGPTGADCPECAVTTYFAAGPLGGYARDDMAFRRVLCEERRSELHRQAGELTADVEAATKATAGVTFLEADPSVVRGQVDGDRATLTGDVALSWMFTDRQPGGSTFTRTWARGWTFRLVNDEGWRVCQVNAPELCGTVLNCEAPETAGTSPTPRATPSDGDLLQYPREMLPCGPRDPFRELHDCSASPSSTPN